MTTTRERLLQAHQVAASYYAATLRAPRTDGPRDYLTRRGLGSLLDDPSWTVGYAPRGWMNLTGHLHRRGFTHDEIATSGLAVVSRRGDLLDRFRDRIVLGLHDEHGDLVGFVGRSAPREGGTCPKYLNSPLTPLYSKGSVLFGLTEQRQRLAAGATPVVVEGPFDVLGVASLDPSLAAVSSCGTVIRPAQAELLKTRSGETVVVAFDADDPGRRAARTAYERLSAHFPTVLGARLPDGEDPSSLAVSQPELLSRRITTAPALADQLVDDVIRLFEDRLDSAEARVCALHSATRLLVRLLPGDVPRQVARVSERLDLEPAEVTRDLVATITRDRDTSTPRPTTPVVPSQRRPARQSRSIGPG